MPSKEEDVSLDIDPPPTDINPYTVLDLSTDASPSQIKSAYRKAALAHHPDKAGPSPADKSVAHTKFQEIAFAYAILSDERRRRRYDTTGRTEETLDLDDDDFDWVSFYREQYSGLVTTEKIQAFSDEFKGGEEERGALLQAYERFRGDLGKCYNVVMLSDPADDEERFRGIIAEAIAKGEVEAYEKFTREKEEKWRRRVREAVKRREESQGEVEQLKKEVDGKKKGKQGAKKGGDDVESMGDLAALIQKKQQGRSEDFFANLEAKYGGGSGKKGTKRNAVNEPPEEAFAANRKKGRGKS